MVGTNKKTWMPDHLKITRQHNTAESAKIAILNT